MLLVGEGLVEVKERRIGMKVRLGIHLQEIAGGGVKWRVFEYPW